MRKKINKVYALHDGREVVLQIEIREAQEEQR